MAGIMLIKTKVVERYRNNDGLFARIISTPDESTLEVRSDDWNGNVIFTRAYETRKGAAVALGRRYGQFIFAGMMENIHKERRFG